MKLSLVKVHEFSVLCPMNLNLCILVCWEFFVFLDRVMAHVSLDFPILTNSILGHGFARAMMSQ